MLGHEEYLVDILEDGALIVIPTCIYHALDIPFRLPTEGKECLCLGRDQQLIVYYRPKEWLDTKAIASSDEEVCPGVVEAESELAAEPRQERSTIDLVKCYCDLGVAVAPESVAKVSGQLFSQTIMVVDLAIDDSVNMVVLVMQGLASIRTQIIDGKAAVTECCR